MSDTRYILFTGSMQPKNPMLATEDKIKEIVGAGFKQGKDFDVVSENVLKDKLGKRGGGMMNMDEMTRPLGYKFGTEDGELVGDREQDLKEWEEDTIDRLRKKMEREKFLEKFLEKEKEDEGKREIPDWVEEFLEKRREDPDWFKRLLPKKEDEEKPYIPKFGPDRFFNPDRFKEPDRFLWPPEGWKNDPRYDPMPFPMPRSLPENWRNDPKYDPFPMPKSLPENWRNDPRYDPKFRGDRFLWPPYDNLPERFEPGEFLKRPKVNPELEPYIIRPDDPPFDPEKDVQLLGNETSGLMEDSSGINILGMKLLLQEAADSLDEIDRIDKMNPDEIIREFELMQNEIS